MQAQKFGAEMLIPGQAAALDCTKAWRDGELALKLTDGRTLRTRTVVVASGARYRRPVVPGLVDFEGRGIWYWASALEAKLCAGEEVAIIGGGNSAGQAAVFLADHASRVHMLIRGKGLAATMSRYLIDRIAATPVIELHPNSELTRLYGDEAARLKAISWRDKGAGTEQEADIRNVSSSSGRIRKPDGSADARSRSTHTDSSSPGWPRKVRMAARQPHLKRAFLAYSP